VTAKRTERTQDEVFAEMALKLANLAASAIEEGQQYLDGIQDKELRRRTEVTFNSRLDR